MPLRFWPLTEAQTSFPADNDVAYCQGIVRDVLPDLYLSSLLLDQPARQAAMVLYAFHAELVRIARLTTEPMAGEIRYQWWLEVLSGERAGEAAGNPLSKALLACATLHEWPLESLKSKVEAHIFDLYQDPMQNRGMLEGWCGATRSVPYQLLAMADGHSSTSELAEVCGYAGMASGTASILQNIAFTRSRHQIYVPTDSLKAVDLNAESFLGEVDSRHGKLAMLLVEEVRGHIGRVDAKIRSLEQKKCTTFLPISLLPLYLDAVEKDHMSPFSGQSSVSTIRKQWTLWWARRRPPFC